MMNALPCTAPPYAVLLTRTAEQAQKRLDKPLRLKLLEALQALAHSPHTLGEALKQPLTGVRSHHIKYKGLEWRIAYQVDEAAQRVLILLIGPHENFYRSLKQRWDAWL